MKLLYFTSEYAVKIHDKIIAISGGIEGVKTFRNIDSPIEHIQNDDYYPTFEEKLTHLIFSFNKFHAFNDGNKRISIAIGALFLEINGLGIFINKFINEMENISVTVANNIIDKELLHEIIISLINEEDYNETLQLKVINALEQVDEEYGTINMGADFYTDLF